MNSLPSFKRHETSPTVTYDILSSTGDSYYEVSMLGTTAISCECGDVKKCKHRELAENLEWSHQGEVIDKELQDERLKMPLHGNRGFSLLK